jgi:hypothetical protein
MNRRLLAALLALALTGCAGYKLGSMLPGDVTSVFIPTFVNKTKEPRIEIDATSAAVEEFQKDGSLEVVGEDQADALLSVVLTDYTLTPLAYRKDERTATKEYRLTVFATVSMTRRKDGSVLAQHPRVKGETTFLVTGDLSSSKRQAFPDAAQDLAHNIVERVVEAWQ